MDSFQMHLAVAKVYMEYYPIKNKKDFISGVLDSDLKETKTISHYSDEIKNDTVREIIKAKVNLKKYLEKNIPLIHSLIKKYWKKKLKIKKVQ